ncbi:MAG: rhodanese-like domain-containing protein [Candidatus Rokubacteria bacterium]|nr:rhodanese-like domain-containing protein [Candidatus Rokubacteria bacterium]
MPLERLVASTAAAAFLLVGAAPAAPPDYPVAFIAAADLKAHLDGGGRADIIDVRKWDQYVQVHIKGARSMPLRVVADRAHEITKTGLVVFY